MTNIIDDLGYVVREGDDFMTLVNRMQVLKLACELGHQGCVDSAVELFQSFKLNGTR